MVDDIGPDFVPHEGKLISIIAYAIERVSRVVTQ